MRYHGRENRYGVNALWEVPLRREYVFLLRKIARLYGKSMSWIVRYCVFSLLRDKKRNTIKVHLLRNRLLEKNRRRPRRAHELHRLKVCLYGVDEQVFQELKIQFGMPVAQVVRIALALYLGELYSRRISSWELFWYGLKFFAQSRMTYSGKREVPQVDLHVRVFFEGKDYWDPPEGPCPEFLA
ncbi:MAG: hypothetical protein NZM25_01780 [Leptospiraceae bacterium]|nr:hypothetical protein [Leptospiraceae bacterium]MDW8306905.1 hypothetical protein [Leptospiraceae bacterium]